MQGSRVSICLNPKPCFRSRVDRFISLVESGVEVYGAPTLSYVLISEPLKGSKNAPPPPPQMTPIVTWGKLVYYLEVPFLGSSAGLALDNLFKADLSLNHVY